jgi:hypothetical protein
MPVDLPGIQLDAASGRVFKPDHPVHAKYGHDRVLAKPSIGPVNAAKASWRSFREPP